MKNGKRLFELFLVLGFIALVFRFMYSTEEKSEPQLPDKNAVGETTLKAPPGRLSVNGVWLDMTANELRMLHGEPARIHSQFREYVQWDYQKEGGLNIVLGPGAKVVTVEGKVLKKDGEVVAQPGTPLTQLPPILGESRPPLDGLSDSINPAFSLDGQLVHPSHRGGKVTRVSMTYDYSIVKPPNLSDQTGENDHGSNEYIVEERPVLERD